MLSVSERAQSRLIDLLYKTHDELDEWIKLVKEGKSIWEAKRFAAFVLWNIQGIVDVLPAEWWAKSDLTGRKLGPRELERKYRDLVWELELQFKNPKAKPTLEVREIEKLNYKLDLIAGELARQGRERKVTLCNSGQSGPQVEALDGHPRWQV